jgi:hypothetical protein
MTANPILATAPLSEPRADRTLPETILSYLRWGYGGLVVSFIAYGFYLFFRSALSLAKDWSAVFAAVTAFSILVIARYGLVLLRKRNARGQSSKGHDFHKPQAATRIN